MSSAIQVTLSEDENEIVLEALEADLEDYRDAVKEAVEDGNPDDAQRYGEAAERIEALMVRLRPSED